MKLSKILLSKYRFFLAVVLIIILFGDAFFSSKYGISFKKFGTPVFLFFSVFLWSDWIKCNVRIRNFALGSILLFSISFLFWDTLHNAYSYLGVIIAFIAYSSLRKELIHLLKILAIGSVILAGYEYFLGLYLFESEINTLSGELITVDEKYSAGSFGVFRSKAIFYGPLSLGIFLIGVSLLHLQDLKIHILGLIGAFFANSRLAILIIIVIIVKYLIFKKKLRFVYLLAFVFLIGAASYLSIYSDLFGTSIDRILSVKNLNETANSARIYFWNMAISFFTDFSYINIVVGNNGAYNIAHGNSTESGWLSLLVDNGVAGVLFYMTALIYTFKKTSKEGRFAVIIIVIVMFVVTYHLSAISNFMLWFTIFYFIDYEDDGLIRRNYTSD